MYLRYCTFYFRVYSQLLKKKLTVKEPQAAPSGRIPEEGIVIIDESSVHVSAPADPPVGQDVEVEDGDIDDPDHVQTQANMCVCISIFNKIYRVKI